MIDRFSRTRMLIGDTAVQRLRASRVAIFGVGGVGGYVCEALVRSGVGAFELVDNDRVSITNINRQILATERTLDRMKTEVMRERMLDIAPDVKIDIRNCFFLPENAETFSFAEYDYVVDAVDTVSAKLEIIQRAQAAGVPVISAMGAGNKLDPSRFRVSDITKTSVCPLARVMRRELRKRGIEHVKVVWSDEPPVQSQANESADSRRRSTPGSTAFAPAAAGLVLAAEIVKDLTKTEQDVP